MMNFKTALPLVLVLTAICSTTQARDTKHLYSIEQAMKHSKFEEVLGSDIKLVWGKTNPGNIERKMGEYTTSKKTNAFNKSDQEACEWALLSALKTMVERARNEGANSVINIRSNYKHNEFSSEEVYECHAGAIMAGVALKAEVATVK
jgi:uncharacterized protein YbjQ (UPF0145 family)